MDRCPRPRVWALLAAFVLSLALSSVPARASRAQAAPPPPGTIATFAGSGVGDGSPATSAAVGPYGVAVSNTGDLYVADHANCRVRKISGSTITTVTGNGTCAYSGDGGPATSAEIDRPLGIAVDDAGNVYVSDNACRIREISSGTIATIAGNGACAASGDGGPAASAGLTGPMYIAFSAGSLYISDFCRVRRVTGGMITTIAGNGTCAYTGDYGLAVAASLNFAAGIAVDASGDVYVAERCRVRRIHAEVITTVAGTGACAADSGDGGPALAATLNSPLALATDAFGNLYIGDTCEVREVSGGVISQFAGDARCGYGGVVVGEGGPAALATISLPYGLALDASGALYISDYGDCRLRRVSGGIITTFAGNGNCMFADGSPPTNGALSGPMDIALDAAGDMYVADTMNCRVRKVTAGTLTTIAGNGSCVYGGDGGPATAAGLSYPVDVAVDSSGGIYLAEGDCRIRRIAAGVIDTFAGNGQCASPADGAPATGPLDSYPSNLTLDGSGDLYYSERSTCRIRKVSGGIITTVAGNSGCVSSGDGGPATSAGLAAVTGLAFGPGGDLYIAGDCSVRRVSGGIIATVAGSHCLYDSAMHLSAGLLNIAGISFDAAGNIYSFTGRYSVFDSAGQFMYTSPGCNVVKLSSGVWSRVAGHDVCGYSGDGSAATSASLSFGEMVFDASGNLYGVDSTDNVVRVIYGVGTTPDDGDGVPGYVDNCLNVYNPDQTNTDANNAALGRGGADNLGDACDDTISGDGYTNAQHTALCKNPALYCPIMRADVNGDGKVQLADFIVLAGDYGKTVPAAPERLDQTGDLKITLADLIVMAGMYNQPVSACP